MMSFVSSNKQILVEYRDGDWYSTQSGRLACRAHRNYLDQLDNLGDVSSVLDFMDTDEEVSWAFIEGADTYETHSSIQDAVMTTLLDFVEVATDVRVVTPNVVAGYADRFYEMGISGRNATFEMIIPRRSMRGFIQRTRRYRQTY